MNKQPDKRRLVVLISGRGSNMRSIHERCVSGAINADIVAVISNEADAAGLTYALEAAIATEIVPHRDFTTREAFDAMLAQTVARHKPDYVILAGFMRILTSDFVKQFYGRLINIHPSLLPKYQGLHTHQRALDAGDEWHGASVHFVTAELDAGPVIMQTRVRIPPNATADSLAQAVLEREHLLYPAAVELLCSGKIVQSDNAVLLDGDALSEPLLLA